MKMMDQSFEEFKRSSGYFELVKPLKDKIQYPDNFIRRIFDAGFMLGRDSPINRRGNYKKENKIKL